MMRKNALLLVSLLVLVALAVFVKFVARPAAPSKNPFKDVEIAKVNRIVIKNILGSIDLQKTDDRWYAVAPFRDMADSRALEEVLAALEKFRLGTMVSENAAKYAEFGLDEANATRVQVYVDAKPVLDVYIGNNAGGYNSGYLRIEGSTPVYIANGLPNYPFARDINSFRRAKVFSVSPLDATAFKLKQDKLEVSRVRTSTTTWYFVQPFLSKLNDLTVSDYAKGNESPEALGFANPYLQVSVEVSSKTMGIMVGKKAPPAFPQAAPTCYVKSDGREPILIVSDAALTDLLTSVKTIPKQ